MTKRYSLIRNGEGVFLWSEVRHTLERRCRNGCSMCKTTRSFTNEARELCKDRNHYRYVPPTMKFDYLPLLTGTYGTKPVFYNIRYRIVRVWITAQVIIHKPKCKYAYKVNFSAAVHICRKLLAEKMHPPDVESLIAKYIVPIRPNRKYKRRLSKHSKGAAINFIYRIA